MQISPKSRGLYLYLIAIVVTLSFMGWWQVFINMCYLLFMSLLEVISTFLYHDAREQCREDQRGVGAIQGFEAPELEGAGDLRVRG